MSKPLQIGKGTVYEYMEFDGETVALDRTTGELLNTALVEVPCGSDIITPKEKVRRQAWREAQKRREEKELYRMLKVEQDKTLGPFIFFFFAREGRLALKEETLARLAVLATNLNYEQCLMRTQRTALCKADVQDILKISRSTFYRFWDEVTSGGFLFDNEGKLYMPPQKPFLKGHTTPTGYDVGRIKIYIEGIRKIYELMSASQHCYLGALFTALPYINVEYNILCKDPFEDNFERIDALSVPEFCALVGKAPSNADIFRKVFRDLHFTEGENEVRLCTIVREEGATGRGRELMFVNPRIMFMGKDYSLAERKVSGLSYGGYA